MSMSIEGYVESNKVLQCVIWRFKLSAKRDALLLPGFTGAVSHKITAG
jgi:hypothetical protein